MSLAQRRAMHINSLRAFYEGDGKLFDKRETLVLQALRAYGPMTDREIMLRLCLPDRNSVAPRITGLIDDGVLAETGNKQDPVTHKRVRIVDLRRDPRRPQLELPIFGEERLKEFAG